MAHHEVLLIGTRVKARVHIPAGRHFLTELDFHCERVATLAGERVMAYYEDGEPMGVGYDPTDVFKLAEVYD
jgi:hypothetical protein